MGKTRGLEPDEVYATERDLTMVAVPRLVARVLTHLEITHEDAAKTMGFTYSAFRDRMRGRTEFRLSELAGLAKVYGFDLAVLMNARHTLAALTAAEERILSGELEA